MKILRVGIASRKAYKKRTLAIAKGKYVPAKSEPKLWFESWDALSQALSRKNHELLKSILHAEIRLEIDFDEEWE